MVCDGSEGCFQEQPLLALPADALGTGQRVDRKFLHHIKALQHQSASSG